MSDPRTIVTEIIKVKNEPQNIVSNKLEFNLLAEDSIDGIRFVL